MSTLSKTGISLSSQIMEGCIDGSSDGTFDTVGVMVGGVEMEDRIYSCLDGTVYGVGDG